MFDPYCLLGYLLFKTPNSPFYIDFLNEGIASGYCPGVGYESSLLHTSFTIGFDNIKDGTSADIEKKIFSTLERVAEEGFNQKMIEGVLHLIEAGSRIEKSNFGMALFQNILAGLNHNKDEVIEAALDVTNYIGDIRENLKDKDYFKKLIEKYLLKNERRLHLELIPDENYLVDIKEQEAASLKEK